jgi:hypothetical protein
VQIHDVVDAAGASRSAKVAAGNSWSLWPHGYAARHKVIRQAPDEVLMGFDDKHLDFRVVATVNGGFVTLTTIVRWHNAWGRAYLAAIMPFHRAIAARMIEGVS